MVDSFGMDSVYYVWRSQYGLNGVYGALGATVLHKWQHAYYISILLKVLIFILRQIHKDVMYRYLSSEQRAP